MPHILEIYPAICFDLKKIYILDFLKALSVLSFQNLFEFWPSTSHLWHTDVSHNPSLAPRPCHALCCSFKVGAYFTKAFSTLNCWAGGECDCLWGFNHWSRHQVATMKLWDSEGLYRLSLNWSRLYRESFLLLKYVIYNWSHWLFLPRWLDFPAWICVISSSFFFLVYSYARVFFRLLIFFLTAFLSHCEFSEAVPVHVCGGLCSFGHSIEINGLVVHLAIWNGCDSAVLYELLISFPDPVCIWPFIWHKQLHQHIPFLNR